ncbi:TQXA domain-containing protein [Streptococcus equi]|uniref:TQXA domain-containing protein n=1 Tax=Streptococcus equi TaxID=1336 RepID=UPI0024A9201D|nr:TQXA domain-containing protein [Streptococcus equi]MDI5901063.1 TQXA domain-containing protein [Streptococcus equi subsp. zooepidemicus]MDI5946143.1 TQXA domain-containing protein [Streptococcus equi subsp. zooepidemicus]MDI5957823.1 TQXA domain-containing protein [Streptococcus equi subsp. zooepidemicus]MDI5960642.1 TQXA domain-containing protein [Streptococcus equi subsp. zooepidemicus]MDI6089143.1 TQXA domain-containing protein [Streptococcus equi subsp. zooepidemicus]
MRTLLKKMLAGAVAFTMLLLNLTCGMMTALAEQYYGWSDKVTGSGPNLFYVTPTSETERKLTTPVFCLEMHMLEPLQWGNGSQRPNYLVTYDKYDSKTLAAELVKKPSMVSVKTKSKLETLLNSKSNSLAAVLCNGYPNKGCLWKYSLTDEEKKQVTQLALWHYTDNIQEDDLISRYLDNASEDKKKALKDLIAAGKNGESRSQVSLTFYTRYNDRYAPNYQSLIGSIIVPEEPQSNLEIGGGNVIDLTYQSGPIEEGGHSGGTTEVEDTKKPDVIIGGQGSVTETTEDTQEGMAGSTEAQPEVEDTKQPQSDIILGGQGNVIDTTENTQEGMSGQSGNIAETEDTKQPQSDIILGGQGNVIETTEDTQAGMSGTNDIQTFEEDTRPKLEFHFDNELPNDAPKPEQPEQPRKPQQEQQSLPRPIEGNQSLPKTHEAKDILALVGVGILSMLGLVFWFRPYQKD